MKKYQLFTVGYEGRQIDEFISYLKQFNVDKLIDIREIPLSRKRGFSKTSLRIRLEQENIEYIHIKALGSPSSIRNQLRFDWNYDNFFKSYDEHLSNNMNSVKEVLDILSKGNTCIMCFERSHEKCHRNVVADKIKEYDGNGLQIRHI
ncbi:conserved hypothetical protein [Candidatus Zixiibacteriota bacterium]|nr:conserved hypothetical protein [candidate division Zixibacteria bacterium]